MYADGFDQQSLQTQLEILGTTVPADINTIIEVLSYLKKISPSEKELLNQIVILAKLVLVVPATTSTSERSFSAMR